jgi:hypothetical protein
MEWFLNLLDKLETPALIVSVAYIGLLYRLFLAQGKGFNKLADETHEMAKIVAGQNAIINLCCLHGRGSKGGE